MEPASVMGVGGMEPASVMGVGGMEPASVMGVVSLASVRGSQTSHSTMSVHTTHNAYTRDFIVIQKVT